MDNKKIKIIYIDGTTQEFIVNKLSVPIRNELLYKYLDLNKVMNNSGSLGNLSEVIREDKNILEFMTEVIVKSIKDIDINKLDGSENDRIFNEVFEYSVGIGDKSKN